MPKLKYSKEEAEVFWQEFETDLVTERYAVRDPETGKAIEFTYQDVKNRICNEFTKIAIVNAIQSNEIITATPFLMFGNNPHSNRKGYFSCFPLGDVVDSTESIFQMERNLVTIFQHAGGGGIDVSNLRPAGSMVDNGQGIASGPVSFAKGYAQLSTRISQGGKRRGALMIQMNYQHADRDEFISFKSESNGQFAGCNVSLNITDDDFWKNEELIDQISEQIWKCGDPGLLFTEKSKANTPVPNEHNPVFSNPCGEYLSTKDTACNLLTVNLIAILQRIGTDDVFEALEEVRKAAHIACIAGNEILDMKDGLPPIEAIIKNTKRFRPVGIGMTGLHYFMNHFNISYADEKDAPNLAKLIQFSIMLGSMQASMNYGEKLLFKDNKIDIVSWDKDYCSKLQDRAAKLFLDNPKHKYMTEFKESFATVMNFIYVNGGLYNSVTTSQAPTGSTSQMLRVGCTGIEPYFELITKRKYVDTSKSGSVLKEVTLIPMEFYDYTEEKLEWVESQIAHKITPEQQIRILSAIQTFCHTAASKTINLPEETTVQQIKDILFQVKDSNLKGITMFRDSSIEGILSGDNAKEAPEFSNLYRRKGETVKFKGLDGVNLYVTANKGSHGHIREIFMNTNWGGSEGYAISEALGRVISLALQKDFTMIDEIVKTLENVSADGQWTCPDLNGIKKGARFRSIPQAIASVLQVLHDSTDLELTSTYNVCPTCKEKAYRRSGGCGICISCGYSSC